MDDATIVRTLAEFEGYRPTEVVDFDGSKSDAWISPLMFDGVVSKLPDYLKDFNAIVRIWRKCPHTTRIAAWGEMFYVEYWYEATPRQHAEALATAIAGHKENGNE